MKLPLPIPYRMIGRVITDHRIYSLELECHLGTYFISYDIVRNKFTYVQKSNGTYYETLGLGEISEDEDTYLSDIFFQEFPTLLI